MAKSAQGVRPDETFEQYNNRMNDLFGRVCESLHDERLADVAYVSCAVIAHTLNNVEPEDRAEFQARIYKFLASLIGQYK